MLLIVIVLYLYMSNTKLTNGNMEIGQKIEVKVLRNLNMILSFNFGEVDNSGNKFFASVNGTEYMSINSYNFKADPQSEIDFVIDQLRGGAYKFFVN